MRKCSFRSDDSALVGRISWARKPERHFCGGKTGFVTIRDGLRWGILIQKIDSKYRVRGRRECEAEFVHIGRQEGEDHLHRDHFFRDHPTTDKSVMDI
jgi:hypothetical protein